MSLREGDQDQDCTCRGSYDVQLLLRKLAADPLNEIQKRIIHYNTVVGMK